MVACGPCYLAIYKVLEELGTDKLTAYKNHFTSENPQITSLEKSE